MTYFFLLFFFFQISTTICNRNGIVRPRIASPTTQSTSSSLLSISRSECWRLYERVGSYGKYTAARFADGLLPTKAVLRAWKRSFTSSPILHLTRFNSKRWRTGPPKPEASDDDDDDGTFFYYFIFKTAAVEVFIILVFFIRGLCSCSFPRIPTDRPRPWRENQQGKQMINSTLSSLWDLRNTQEEEEGSK